MPDFSIIDKAVEEIENGLPSTEGINVDMFSPCQIENHLNSLGYEKGVYDTNGWQVDFWIPFTKEGFPTILYGGSWWYGDSSLSRHYLNDEEQ